MRKTGKWMALLLSICMLGTGCGSAPADTQTAGEEAGGASAQTESAEETAPAEAKADGETQKVIWFTSATKYKTAYEAMAKKLLEEENIEIEFQQVADDQYHTMLKTKLATGDAPDIFDHNAPTEYGTVNAQENCVDLTDAAWVSRLVNPDLLKDKDGKIWAFPTESSECYFSMYYNKGLMEELGLSDQMNPKTYDEFLTLCQKIKDAGVTPVYFPDKDSSVMQCWVTSALPIVLSVNHPDALEKIRVNEAKWTDYLEYQEVLNTLVELYGKGYVNENHASATQDMWKEAVATGEAAMMYTGEWTVTDMLSKYPDLALGSFAVPFADQDATSIGAYVSSIYVCKNGPNTDAALRVLDCFSQPAYMNLYYEELPGFPAFSNVDGGQVPQCVQDVVDNYVQTNKYFIEMNGAIPEMSSILPDLWKNYVDMVNGGSTPKQVVDEWQAKYEEYMTETAQTGF